MAQVTTYLHSAKDGFLEYSLNGTTWTDISGIANSISFSGGDRASGEVYTINGTYAIVGAGKIGPTEATISIVYDDSGAVYTTLRGYFTAQTWVYFRWTPKGDNPGNITFTSALGPILSCPPPAGDASAADPLTVELTHKSSSWVNSTLTT
jgi:hypothetical protein